MLLHPSSLSNAPSWDQCPRSTWNTSCLLRLASAVPDPPLNFVPFLMAAQALPRSEEARDASPGGAAPAFLLGASQNPPGLQLLDPVSRTEATGVTGKRAIPDPGGDPGPTCPCQSQAPAPRRPVEPWRGVTEKANARGLLSQACPLRAPAEPLGPSALWAETLTVPWLSLLPRKGFWVVSCCIPGSVP